MNNPWVIALIVVVWTTVIYRMGHEMGRIRGVHQGAESTAYVAWAAMMVTADLTYGEEWFSGFFDEMRRVSNDEIEQARVMALAQYLQRNKEDTPWQARI